MAGLVQAIRVFLPRRCKDVDARDKPGHDERGAIDAPANPLLLSVNENNSRAGNHDQIIQHQKRRNALLRRRLAQLSLRQDHDRRRHRRLERIRRRLWRARRHRGDRTAVGAGGRQERVPARADLRGTVCRHASGRRRRGGAGARRHRERAARRQGQGARRALLRIARRKNPRPHPGLLVALRDLAHQSSGLVQAGDHRPRWRQVESAAKCAKSASPR